MVFYAAILTTMTTSLLPFEAIAWIFTSVTYRMLNIMLLPQYVHVRQLINLDWLLFQFCVLLCLRCLCTASHVRRVTASLRSSCSGKLVDGFCVVICLWNHWHIA